MKMAVKKIEANRRNARKSTGADLKKGKIAVRYNALKHGIPVKKVVIPAGDEEKKRAPETLKKRNEAKDSFKFKGLKFGFWLSGG